MTSKAFMLRACEGTNFADIEHCSLLRWLIEAM